MPGLKYFLRSTYQRIFGPGQLKAKLKQGGPIKIVIGASKIFEKGWILTEHDYLNLLREEDFARFFAPNSIDAMIAEHVWEHLSLEDGCLAAQNCFKYIKPGGYLRVAVPDGNFPDPDYIEHVKVNGIGWGADDHKVLYTFETMKANFEKAGFKVHVQEYWDNDGKFVQNEWDVSKGYVRRTKDHDERNKGGELKYTSILIDAVKE